LGLYLTGDTPLFASEAVWKEESEDRNAAETEPTTGTVEPEPEAEQNQRCSE